MESVIYAIVQLSTLVIMIVFGKKLSSSSSSRQYWITALVPLFMYSFAYGLRFGRLVDWNLYYFRYINLGKDMNLEEYEWVFEYICHFLYQLGIPYPGFIFLQCLFFMFSILLLFSINRDIVRWGLPIAFAFGGGNEMFIRYFVGFSFSIIAIYFLQRLDYNKNKRLLLAFLFTIIGGLCHSACYFMIIIVIGYRLLGVKRIPWQVSIPLLFLTTFIFSISQFHFLVDMAIYISAISGDDFHGASYLDHVDELIAGDFLSVGYMSASFQTSIRTFCFTVPVIYFAKKYMREKSIDVFFYNLFVIGAVLNPCFGTVELLNRISSSMHFFGCIPCALCYVNVFKKSKRNIEFYLLVISLFFLLYPYINDALFRSEDLGLLYIWDAAGRDYLPI